MDNKFSHQAPSHSTDGYMPSVSTPSTYDTTNDQQSSTNEIRPEHISAQPAINNPNTALNSNFDNQSIATEETLIHYYPQVSYETGNDPENPVWRITPICYDYEESGLPFTAYEIAIYAHDGSVCGYRDLQSEG